MGYTTFFNKTRKTRHEKIMEKTKAFLDAHIGHSITFKGGAVGLSPYKGKLLRTTLDFYMGTGILKGWVESDSFPKVVYFDQILGCECKSETELTAQYQSMVGA